MKPSTWWSRSRKRSSTPTKKRLEPVDKTLVVRPHANIGFGTIAVTMFRKYLKRSVLGFVLIVAQAFLYNGIFFTYALVLVKFYRVPPDETGLYLLPFAISNFLGAVLLT